MTIIEALKKENLRIDNGNRWLYYDKFNNMWVVREQRRYKKISQILVETTDEEVAVAYLLAN